MSRAAALIGFGAAFGAALAVAPDVLGREQTEAEDTAPLDTPKAEPEASTPRDAKYAPSRSFAPLVKAVDPAVVAIEVDATMAGPDISSLPPGVEEFLGVDPRAFGPRTRHGEGSGFVVSADGLVLTNHHVVDGADAIRVRFSDGTIAKAAVLGSDENIDVALLKLEGDRTWPYVELGTAEGVEVGDWVLAVGNPLGLGTTVTAGIISGKGRAIGHDVWDDFLQTDAAINEGNSGGPLFDVDGRVIGINTAIIAGANTIGFAIPIDMVVDVMDDLQDRGYVARGYIGVRPEKAEPTGAKVAHVYDDTPASKAGLVSGDVIVEIDGKGIADPVDLVRTIGSRSPGDTVELAIQRDGKPMKVAVELGERPDENRLARQSAGTSEQGAPKPRLGVGLRSLSDSQAKKLDVDYGVQVSDVDESGPAYGFLQPGDLILEVNHWPVKTPDQVKELVARTNGSVTFLVQRDGARRFVVVPLR